MTLISFTPEKLDALALRLFDLAALLRKMAVSSRENEVANFALHGQKVDEWLGRLEEWTHTSEARLQAAVHRQRGAWRAQALAAPQVEKLPLKRPVRRKKKA